jgi:glycosyltransferase involved in cell wall biosynthesis
MKRSEVNDEPMVSVVMPVYNGENFLREALESVLLQTYRNLEILVVDDGSVDGSRQILEEYAARDRRVRVFTQENGGVANARNLAIDAAKGEFIAPIDADDMWFPEKIELQMQQMLKAGEEAGLVYCWWAWIDEAGTVVDRSPRWKMWGNVLKELVFINFTGNASVPLFRKSCLLEVGRYNPQLAADQAGGCEDWELALRIAARYQVRVVRRVLLGYRRRSGSMSSACQTMWRSQIRVMEEIRKLAPDLEPALFRASSNQFAMYLAGVSFWAGRPLEAIFWGLRAGVRLPIKVAPFVIRLLVRRTLSQKSRTVMRPGEPLDASQMPGPLLPYDKFGDLNLALVVRTLFFPALKVLWWCQLLRFRMEAWRGERGQGPRKLRVWATACWDFPVYSQTFVYREIASLLRADFEVRFTYERLGRRRDLPDECADLWSSKRKLLITRPTADWALAYYWRFKPERLWALVQKVADAAGWETEDVLANVQFRQAFAFARLAEAWKADYIHSYFFYEHAMFGLVASTMLDVPRGVSCYADHMLNDHDLKLVGMHLRHSDVIVATSNRIKRELEQLAGIPLEAAVVKPNGIDSRLYQSAKRSSSGPRGHYKAVAVNRIHPKKGMTYLLEAALVIRESGLPVTIDVLGEVDALDAATPAYAEQLRAFLNEHSLEGTVTFLGRQTTAQVRTHLAQADLFVAPYVELPNGDKDGIPTALLEAMASGCAVVVTDAGSILEVIRHQVDGIVVPQRDSEALAAAMIRLCTDPALRERLAEAAAKRVEASFDARVCEIVFHARIRDAVAARDPLRFDQPTVRTIHSPGIAKNVRIILLSFEYPPETGYGGIGTYTWYQARALVRLGYSVHVLAGSRDLTPLRTSYSDGVIVHRFCGLSSWTILGGLAGWFGWRWTQQRLVNASSMAEGLRQLTSKYPFDVIEMPECGGEGFLFTRRTPAPTVVRLHGPAALIMHLYRTSRIDRFLCKSLEQVALGRATRVTSCSRFLANEVQTKMGVTREIPVIYNGIDLALFDQEPSADLHATYSVPLGDVTILFAGRMEQRKGIYLCGEIARATLPGRKATLLLAGEDVYGYVRQTLVPYLEEQGISASVRVIGKLGMKELRACAKAVDIYLLPSLWENCPYACLEAMAAGRPIVCSNQGGMPELIEHEVNGLLAEAGSALSFACQLLRLIDDEDLRKRLGRKARASVEQRFGDDLMAQQSADVYAVARSNR